MFTSFFSTLDKIFQSFASGWQWLTEPMDLNISNPPAFIAPLLELTPLAMISISTVGIVLTAYILKLVWDAIPIV